MTAQEAVQRIKNHNEMHSIKERGFAIHITEALNMGIEALEKQIPKKPKTLTYRLLVESGWKHECPNCGCAVGKNKYTDYEYIEPYEDYCSQCGQRLDWSDVK